MPRSLHTASLAEALPPASAQHFYNCTLESFLALRATWVACPHEQGPVLKWLELFFVSWVRRRFTVLFVRGY